jgi:glycosyltransferase involved in cell wall biosynthesis
VPNFVPLAEIDAAEAVDDARLSRDDELLVHVGRLSFEKNLPLLVDALRHVVRARPRAKLVFLGEGQMLPELSARIGEAGLRERTVFAGFVPNVASWLKRAAAVVAVSLYEGHPNAVLEAVAARTPVIVSDIPAYRAILDGGAAAFVEPRDVRGIAAAIINTLDDRATAAQRAAHAQQALHALSLEATAERYETAYRRAIAHRS